MEANPKKLTRRTFYDTCTIGGAGRKWPIKPPAPEKIPLIFFRTAAGGEPVREWLRALPETEPQTIGMDLQRAQWRWPVGMPLCRPMGTGLWEIRTDLPTERTARVLLCVYRGHLVALHGFIKKTRATPDEDLEVARKRQKELMR
jgi:phage-related protein